MTAERRRRAGAVLLLAGFLFWSLAHAQFPGDFVYRGAEPEQALPQLRDAAIAGLRGLPGMEPGYPKAATIRAVPLPGRAGEMRLVFEPSDDRGAQVRGILLDSRGSALQLQQDTLTARVRLVTVYLPGRDGTLATEADAFRVQQIEIGLPYLAPGSRLDVVELGRAIASGLRHAGAQPLHRLASPAAEPGP